MAARGVADAFLTAVGVPVGGYVHARLGGGGAAGLGDAEGGRGARRGVVLGGRSSAGVCGWRFGGWW